MNKDMQESFNRIFSKLSPLKFGLRAELLDMVFAYRFFFGRMPTNEEIVFFSSCKYTWREFLTNLLSSEEFSKRLDFLPGGLVLMTESNGFRFWFNSTDREMGTKMATGQYEPKVVRFLKDYLKPGMTCLDIGAQTGFYSIIMATCVGTTGKILAFEPLLESFNLLRKNIKENYLEPIVYPFNVACSNTSGTMSAGIASNMVVADPLGSNQFKCVALDNFVNESIQLCKIDVEGHEPKVLDGMTRLVEQYRPILITEMNAYWLSKSGSSISAYTEKLEKFDYALLDIDNDFRRFLHDEDDILKNVNILAIPEEKFDSIF